MSTSTENPYHHGDLRRALVEAGLALLASGGADNLGLREVARAVGVSASAPYRHFESRQALLAEIAREGFVRFDRVLRAAAEGVEPPARLAAMGRAYIGFALANPPLYRLMFSPLVSKDANPSLMEAARLAYDSLAALVAPGDPRGLREKTIGFWALVHGLSMLLLDDQVRLDGPEDREALLAAILDRYGTALP